MIVIRSGPIAGDDFGGCQLLEGRVRHRERMCKLGYWAVECFPINPLLVSAD